MARIAPVKITSILYSQSHILVQQPDGDFRVRHKLLAFDLPRHECLCWVVKSQNNAYNLSSKSSTDVSNQLQVIKFYAYLRVRHQKRPLFIYSCAFTK